MCFTEAEQKINHHFLDGSRVKKFYLRKTKKNSKQIKKKSITCQSPPFIKHEYEKKCIEMGTHSLTPVIVSMVKYHKNGPGRDRFLSSKGEKIKALNVSVSKKN